MILGRLTSPKSAGWTSILSRPSADRTRPTHIMDNNVFYSRSNTLNVNFIQDFPGGAVVKNPPANAGDTGSSPGPGISHMPRSN